VAKSVDGTLVIESAEGCVRGTYSIVLSTLDQVEGSFDAVACD